MSPLLSVTGLSVEYGPVRAVDSVNLDVHEGQLVGLIGPNGAGKTSFIDAITGFIDSSGSVRLSDIDISGMAAFERCRRGLARTWQSLELFDGLTVGENLMVASQRQSLTHFLGDLVRPGRRRSDSDISHALETAGISALVDRFPSEISQGQRKLVGVARALATRPRLVCMDEPAAGLDSDESLALGRRLRKLVAGGTAILLVDHDMDLVLEVCDEIVVVDFGRVIARGTPDEVRNDPSVIDAYLGSIDDTGDAT